MYVFKRGVIHKFTVVLSLICNEIQILFLKSAVTTPPLIINGVTFVKLRSISPIHFAYIVLWDKKKINFLKATFNIESHLEWIREIAMFPDKNFINRSCGNGKTTKKKKPVNWHRATDLICDKKSGRHIISNC